MFQALFKVFKSCIKSRIGQLFFIIHLILFVVCAVTLRGLSSVEEFETHFLKKVFFVIILFDYPIVKPLNLLMNYFAVTSTKFTDFISGLIASVQWWIIGYIIGSIIKAAKKLIMRFEN